MADFIEREALKADLQESYEGLKNIYKVLKHDEERRICEAQLAVITEAILRVKDAPAADVVEVRHGRWLLERTPDGKPYCFHCSVCDDDFHHIGIMTVYDYCPNCGAYMMGESNGKCE